MHRRRGRTPAGAVHTFAGKGAHGMAGQEGRITAQRLREAMEARHLRQTDLCRATGIPKSAMCQYLKGDFSPKAGRLRLLAKALCVNEAWLSGYEGAPMHAPAPSAEQMDPLAAELFSAYAEAKDALSADDIEDVKLFMRMLARRRRRQKSGQGKAE